MSGRTIEDNETREQSRAEMTELREANEVQRKLLDDAITALRGAQVTLEAWSMGDPCNNDNYNRVADILARARELGLMEGE